MTQRVLRKKVVQKPATRPATGSTPIRITESFDSPSPRQVDVDKGIIPDVKFHGLRSKKGYDYDPKGVRDAVSLYEGIQIFADHPDPKNPKRSVRELIAVGVQPRYVGDVSKPVTESDGVYGTLKVFKETAGGRLLLEAAQDSDKSRVLGLSHNADPTTDGKGRPQITRDPRTGRHCVLGIAKVYSVDLVDNPATTNGLYESADMKTNTVLDVFRSAFPVGKTVRLLEDAGLPMDAPMPGVSGDEVPLEDQVEDAFLAMVTKVWKDDKLDSKAKLAKIKDIAAAQEKLLGGDDPEPAVGGAQEGDEEDKPAVKEGKPITIGKLMESAKKYKVDDSEIIEQASLLPELRAVKLLESVGRRQLAGEDTVTAPRTTPKSAVPDTWDGFSKHLQEGLAEEERGQLMEAL